MIKKTSLSFVLSVLMFFIFVETISAIESNEISYSKRSEHKLNLNGNWKTTNGTILRIRHKIKTGDITAVVIDAPQYLTDAAPMQNNTVVIKARLIHGEMIGTHQTYLPKKDREQCPKLPQEIKQTLRLAIAEDGENIKGVAKYYEVEMVQEQEYGYDNISIICSLEGPYEAEYELKRAKICGPDISDQLVGVLKEVKKEFKRWGKSKKKEVCDAVRIQFPENFKEVERIITLEKSKELEMSWDICELFLPLTSWLYLTDSGTENEFTVKGCGTPSKGDPGTAQIETLPNSPCGNSVQVGTHCYLAGTVNYALYGKIARLCNDEFGDFDIESMRTQILGWKKVEKWMVRLDPGEDMSLLKRVKFKDDPDPPTAWAEWGYKGLPVSSVPVGRAANRDYCTERCSVPMQQMVPGKKFTWRWLPHKDECANK